MNSKRHSKTDDHALTHPMLLHGAGIATIVAACTSVANSLALSVIMLLLCSGMALIYIFEKGEYIQPMLSVLYFVPAAFIVCGCGFVLNNVSPATSSGLGMYLPLLAADALVLARVQPDAPFVSPSDALPKAIRLWWLYAATALPIGLLREMLGRGTVFGHRLFFNPAVGGMNLPFAGFILLGFALAICSLLSHRGSE